MKRKEFMHKVLHGSVFMTLVSKAFRFEKEYPDPALVQGGTPAQITGKAVSLLGGMRRFVSKDDIVMIKSNIAFDRKPKFAGCTNPDVVATLIKLSRRAGAKEVRVMDNPVHPAQASYKNSGIAEAVEKSGGKLLYPDSDRLVSVQINGKKIKTDWEILF